MSDVAHFLSIELHGLLSNIHRVIGNNGGDYWWKAEWWGVCYKGKIDQTIKSIPKVVFGWYTSSVTNAGYILISKFVTLGHGFQGDLNILNEVYIIASIQMHDNVNTQDYLIGCLCLRFNLMFDV